MLIEGQGLNDFKPLHQHKRNAVSQREGLVCMLLKVLPPFMKQRFFNVNQMNIRCGKQVVADPEGLGMLPLLLRNVTISSRT